MMSNEDIDYMRLYQETYDTAPGYRINNWGVWTLPLWLDVLPPGEPVIDLGCGNGLLCDVMSVLGFKKENTVGVDVINGIFERKRYTYHRLDITKEQLPFPDKFFGLLTCFDALEHIAEKHLDFVLAEIMRVSKRQVLCPNHGGAHRPELHLTIQSANWWLDTLRRFAKDWRIIPVGKENGLAKHSEGKTPRTIFIGGAIR